MGVDFETEEKAPPLPPEGASTLPVAPEPEKVFMDIGRETPLEQLRGNYEAMIKLASQPVSQMVEQMKYFEELDAKVRQGMSAVTAWNLWSVHYYTKVQNKMGAAESYPVALAQSVIAFLQEQKRGKQ